MRHPSEVLKGSHMPVEEGFLLACRKSHDKGTTRVREVHHEDLDFLLHPCQDHLRLPPVPYKYRFFYPRARACSRARRFCLFRRSFSFCVFFLCKAEGVGCFWGAVMVWGQDPACKMPTANGWDWYCMASRISLPRTTQLKRRAGSCPSARLRRRWAICRSGKDAPGSFCSNSASC